MSNIMKKQEVVSEIKEKISKASSVVLVDGRGLTVYQDTDLRKKLREAGIEYKVYKNTLLHLAIQDTPFEPLDAHLAGPTTVAISYDDGTAAARAINKEIKNLPNLQFKAGVVENTLYDAAGVKAIAEIPPRAELLSRLLGSFKSPISSFARVINELAKKRGGGAEPEAKEPAEAEPVAQAAAEPVAEPAAEPVTEA